jgi:hypothetical protein
LVQGHRVEILRASFRTPLSLLGWLLSLHNGRMMQELPQVPQKLAEEVVKLLEPMRISTRQRSHAYILS